MKPAVYMENKPLNNFQYDEHIVSDSELTITPLSYNKDLKQFSVSVSVGEEGIFILLFRFQTYMFKNLKLELFPFALFHNNFSLVAPLCWTSNFLTRGPPSLQRQTWEKH